MFRKLLCVVYLLLIFSHISLRANQPVGQGEYILLIDSYTEYSSISNRLSSALTEFVQKRSNIKLYTEQLQMLIIDNLEELQRLKYNILDRYPDIPPSVVVLFGNPAFLMNKQIREKWGDVPVVLCASQLYMCDEDDYIMPCKIDSDVRVQLSEYVKHNNMTVLYSQFFVHENVDLVCHMIPDIKKFVFISDIRFITKTFAVDIGNILKREYPNIEYLNLSSENLTTNQLLDSLYNIDYKTTGVLYSSWFTKRTYIDQNYIIANNFYDIAATTAPLFSLGMVIIGDDNGGLVGGYNYNEDIFDQRMVSVIDSILSGRTASSIKCYAPSGRPIFNYGVMVAKNLNPQLAPASSLFINKVPTFWQQHGFIIIVSSIIIFIIVLASMRQIVFLRRIRLMQQKEIENLDSLSNLIDNMPLLYLQIKLVPSFEPNIYSKVICTKINPYCKVIGVSQQDIIGKDISKIDSSLEEVILEVANSDIKENHSVSFTFYFTKIKRYFQVKMKWSTTANVIDTFFVDTTDLYKMYNQLAKSNSQLSLALDVAKITPWKLDLKNNLQIFKFYDYNSNDGNGLPEEKYMPVDFDEINGRVCEEDKEMFRQELDKLVKGIKPKMKLEIREKRMVNGKMVTIWNELIGIVDKYDENRKLLSIMGLSHDITDRKNVELELIKAKNRAEESNRLKSAFLANMSHEIRTPLNAIIGFSQVLSSATSDEERNMYVDIIETNNNLLLQLINDILDLSKIEAGTIEFNISKVQIKDIISDAVSIMRNKNTKADVVIEYDEHSPSISINTDSNRLMQTVINLMNNALKFTDKGFVRVGYKVRSKDIYFFVEDNGIGVPQAKLTSIFERFTKLDSFKQGTGLGLSICQTLVQKLGGEIGVESHEGVGSKFWFTLPKR